MKNIINLIIIVIVSNNLSFCQKSPVEKCINKRTVKNYNFIDSDFNLFDSIKEFESSLIKSSLLKGKRKSDYLIFIKRKNNFQEINGFIKNVKLKHSFLYQFNEDILNMTMVYSQCPSEVIRNAKQTREDNLVSIKKSYDKISAEGYPKKFILEELVEKINFNDDTSRLMLCNLIYLNWYINYKNELYKRNLKSKN